MATILAVRNINKHFGGLKALDEVSFAIEEGRISSLIGPNGAGKTTLFNVVAGALRPDSGTVTFMSHNITGMRPYEVCRKGIARTYQLKTLFPNLTVFDNIMGGMLKDPGRIKDKADEVFEILDFIGLKDKADVVVSSLPPLEAKFVELGRALATHPKLLLLDELLGGLVPSETAQICDAVRALRDSGMTILQIGHEMGPIMKTSDWVVVLNKGSKLAEGPTEQIKTNEAVLAVYLEAGGGADE